MLEYEWVKIECISNPARGSLFISKRPWQVTKYIAKPASPIVIAMLWLFIYMDTNAV